MELEKFKIVVLSSRMELLRYTQTFIPDGDEAEDIIQEVMIRLWNSRQTLDLHPNIPGLTRTMTKNLCLNRIKQFKRNTSLDGLLNLQTRDHNSFDDKDRVKFVLEIIENLPPLQKAIFRMKHIDGYEVDEMAEATGCSAESIRMNLSRARKKMKEIFDKSEE